MKPFKALLTSCLLAATLFTAPLLTAQEENYDNTTNFTVGLVDYFFDADRFQQNNLGIALGAETPLSGRWSIGVDYLNLNSEVENAPLESDVDYLRFGFNYHFNQYRGWQPYAGVGIGSLEISPSAFAIGGNDEDTFSIGVGAKHYLNEQWLIRTDLKFIKGDNNNPLDTAFTLGFSYVLGSRPEPAPVAAAPQPEPVPVVMDSDGDGVPDNRDACANTPRGAQVDARGCELDSDRDGVVDSRDNCPDTPTNLMVDANGCPILDIAQRRQELLVEFAFDMAAILPEYRDEIADFAEFMEIYGNTTVVIEGHTDSQGSEIYNQTLSERRATAVRDALINDYGIDNNRVMAVGYGESRPIASNDTEAGRARNRRIEAEVTVQVEEQRQR